jgi:hypothetical protein
VTLKRSRFVLALAGLIASGCGGQGRWSRPGAVIEQPVPADFPTADRISVRGEIPIATPR